MEQPDLAFGSVHKRSGNEINVTHSNFDVIGLFLLAHGILLDGHRIFTLMSHTMQFQMLNLIEEEH